MADAPSTPKLKRLTQLTEYFPTRNNDDSPLSPRGQSLSGLLQRRSSSTTNLAKSRSFVRRRRSSFGADLTPQKSADSDDGELPELQGRVLSNWGGGSEDYMRKMSIPAAMVTPEMRSQRLIGNPNPRYRWEQYWKTDEELKQMKKPIRQYYERNNYLIQHYMYIDRLLDSSLPHNLLQEYHNTGQAATSTDNVMMHSITEEPSPIPTPRAEGSATPSTEANGCTTRIKRTPKDIYRLNPDESTPLINKDDEEHQAMPPDLEIEDEADSQSRIVTVAIYVNLAANTILLAMKIVVVALSSSVSVLASLVDAALDFLSTAIIWVTTYLISRNDSYAYPIGRRRLEPVGVLVFSVVMITSFVQVALEGLSKITGPDHTIVQLSLLAILIMAATVVIKGLCWFWCRMIKNSSVQALAQDAMTDVVFNIFSIIFPIVGYYASIWWLDPLGGILLSFWVIFNWAQTSSTHIKNLTGAAASADERNVLLYLTMRFAKTIKTIQGLQAYHSGDKLNVEVDIVLDEYMKLRDSHDLGESLQYVLESVPNVDRAFVHMDYADYNIPSHMQQDS